MFRGGTFQKAVVGSEKVEVQKEVPVQEPDIAMVGRTGIVWGNGGGGGSYNPNVIHGATTLGGGGGGASGMASFDPQNDTAPTKPKRGRIQLPMTVKSKKKK